jgi:hypothetical protein
MKMKPLGSLLLGVMILCGSNLWGQDHCAPFSGTVNGGLVIFDPSTTPPLIGWAGIGTFSFGKNDTLEATTQTITTGVKKGGPGTTSNVFMGAELTTVKSESGEGFLLFTQFVAEHDPFDPSAPARVNETGTIAPIPGSTGKFANVHGHFTSHGPFGAAISPPEGYPFGYIPLGLGWIGEYNGNICGIE